MRFYDDFREMYAASYWQIKAKELPAKQEVKASAEREVMASAKLVPAFTVPIDFKLWTKPDGERAHQEWYKFVPGKEYEVADDLLLKEVKAHKTKKRYDAAIEMKLKDLGITPEVKLCKECDGKKKYLTYRTFEVSDE